jgi:hypothetical protein
MLRDNTQWVARSLDDGVLAWAVRAVLVACAVALLLLAFGRSQFGGVWRADAMEQLDVARELARGHGFTSHLVRPLDLALAQAGGTNAPTTFRLSSGMLPANHRVAPLYPFCLSMVFRMVKPAWQPEAGALYAPERVALVVNGVLLCLAALVVLMVGLHALGRTVGGVAVAAFLMAPSVIFGAVGGGAHALLLVLSAGTWACAYASIHMRTWWQQLLLCVACGLLLGLAVLTSYGAVVLLLGIALFLAMESSRLRWTCPLVVLLLAVLVVAPWGLHQSRAVGQPFGTAPLAVPSATLLAPAETLDTMAPGELNRARFSQAVRLKVRGNSADLLSRGAGLGGLSLIAGLVLVALFVRFEERGLNGLVAGTVCSLVGLFLIAALTSGDALVMLLPAVPCCALLGAAALKQVLDRQDFFTPGAAGFYTAGALVAGALPLAALLLTPVARLAPYPPYHPMLQRYVAQAAGRNGVICTDIPAAVAWYGDHLAMPLPRDPAACAAKVDAYGIGSLYLTQRTRAVPGATTRGQEEWMDVLAGNLPAALAPFEQGLFLPQGRRSQLLLLYSTPSTSAKSESRAPPNSTERR